MAIRTATIEDADALGAIHVRAWQHAYRGLLPDDYLDNLSVDDRVRQWREALQRPPRPRASRFVATAAETVVTGFVAVGPMDRGGGGDLGEVYVLNVDPGHWGKGHGRSLLEAGTAALVTAGFRDAILWVHPDNQRARRFYGAMGWTAEDRERRQEVFGIEVPEVRYRRRIVATAPVNGQDDRR